MGLLLFGMVFALVVFTFSAMLLTADWMEGRRTDLVERAERALPGRSRSSFPRRWLTGGR